MQMVTLNKDDIYQGPLVLVNHNYPIANNYQITNCSTAKDSTISLEKTAMEMLTKALQEDCFSQWFKKRSRTSYDL